MPMQKIYMGRTAGKPGLLVLDTMQSCLGRYAYLLLLTPF
jgi:hypothetical protein